MKKFILPLLSVCLIVGISTTSCKKKEGCTNPEATNYDADAKEDDGSCVLPAAHGEAVITGLAKANLDLSNDTNSNALLDWEDAPATILAKYNEADLYNQPAPGINYGDVIVEATVSGGTYTLKIPANAEPVSVTVMPMDFAYNQIQNTNGDVVRTVFADPSFTMTVYDKSYEIMDIYY